MRNATQAGSEEGRLFSQAKLGQSVWRFLTAVVCIDLTAFGLYSRPWSRFAHTDLLLG